MDEFPNNASATQAGFHYQDLAALYFFISNIKNISEINVEGHDDFDIKYKNGNRAFFQVKELEDISKSLTAAKIKDSLKVLSNDCLAFKNIPGNIIELGIVTNTDRPFGPSSRNLFSSFYMQLSYSQLPESAQKKIKKQLEKLSEDQKSALDVSKLTITKLHYYGNDTTSKLQQLEYVVRNLLGEAKIDSNKYNSLLNEWCMLFSQSTENANEVISKKIFASHTEVIALDNPRFSDFYELFNVTIGNEEYIESQYDKHLKIICQDFKILSRIEAEFTKFRAKNNLSSTRHQQQVDFVNELAPNILEPLGLSNSLEDLDIAKLIIWLVVRQTSLLSSIEEAFSVEY